MKHLFIVAIMLGLIACQNNSNYSKLPEQPAVQTAEVFELQVEESMNAAGYTYIKGTKNESEIWIAIPQTEMEVGQTIYYRGGMQMDNFESKQLNRTFEKILFVERVALEKEKLLAPVKNPHNNAEGEKKPASRPPLPELELDDDVISIEDIYSKREDFEGKSLQVYGVVWKVNNGILDRNWVHIEDGTSSEGKSSLTLTTQEMIKVGDTIKMKGKLTLNKDFGYGYVYDVLLEEGMLVE